MYTAIIADDESKLCKLIQVLGNWEALGIHIIDICPTGDELWKSIQENNPDIVMTDIRMPVMDGLEVVNRYNTEYRMTRHTCFIIISGYAEFEYARQAIQYNIVDYLLKPLDKEQLNATLQKACNILEIQSERTNETSFLKQTKRNLNAIFITDILDNKIPEGFLNKDVLQTYSVSFNGNYYLAIYLNFKYPIPNYESLFMNEFQEETEVAFSNVCDDIIYQVRENRIVIVLNYNEIEGSIFDYCLRFYDGMESLGKKHGISDIYCGIGIEVHSIHDIRKSIRLAKAAEMGRLLNRTKTYFVFEKNENDVALEDVINKDFFSDLEKVINSLSSFEVKKLFKEVSWEFERSRNRIKSGRVILQFTDRVYDSIHVCEDSLHSKAQDKFYTNSHITLRQAKDLSNYLWIMQNSICTLIEETITAVNEEEAYPVQVLKQYVTNNLDKQFSISDIAESLNLSPAYLGNLFHKHTGKFFNTYVTETRMKKARELLRETSDSISKVAVKTGYSDQKYFSKVFKSTYGMSPIEYRRVARRLDK